MVSWVRLPVVPFSKMVKEAIIILSFILGFLIDFFWARLVRGWHLEKKNYIKMIFWKVRIHHNILGYASVVIGIFWNGIILIPAGLGVIIGHATRKGEPVWFIEKAKDNQKHL